MSYFYRQKQIENTRTQMISLEKQMKEMLPIKNTTEKKRFKILQEKVKQLDHELYKLKNGFNIYL